MNLGEKIKALRKINGITQEQLAAGMNVSYQAVSKWENGISYPDIGTIPRLAIYFNVSIDELFDFDNKNVCKQIDLITKEAHKYRETDYKKSREILLDGLKEYPDNEILLNNLLYVTPDTEETITVALKLVNSTKSNDVKYDALRFLAYAYKRKGMLTEAEAAIEQIPEFYFTKLTEMAYLFEDERKFNAASKQKWISFENMIQMMQKLAEYYESIDQYDKAIIETKNALKYIEIENNSSYDTYIDFFGKRLNELNNKKNISNQA